MSRVRILIVNVNLNRETLSGCKGIEEAVRRLTPEVEICIQHWTDLASGWPLDSAWDASILGPNETPFPAYPSGFKLFLKQVEKHKRPLLGICGGHQVLGLAFGSEVGPVYDIPAPTRDYEGLPKVKGQVSLVVEEHGRNVALLSGLPSRMTLDASHVEELRSVPEGFELIASTPLCLVQIMAHRNLPLFGIQCHPEREWPRTDGRRILQNFLALVDASAAS